MKQVLGRNLKVGQTIEVWWNSNPGQTPNRDTIIRIEQSDNTLKCFKDGYRFAYFFYNKVGMTIPNEEYFNVEDK